ncbi:MAG: hypothetical protein WCT49_06630 [Candidatus Paceibacterota bacterium]|jgi:hypothetical protein|nr:hypothetical protein [Candidatus Paceibacterota bacterium]
MNISLAVSLLSGIFILLAFAIYNREIFRGSSKPNVVSWGLWSMVTVLNMASYLALTGDILKNSLSIVAASATFVTFLYIFQKNSGISLTMTDWITLSIGVISAFVWMVFQSAVFANLTLQLANIAAFVPTYRSVWNNPENEKPLPWFFFSTAYLFLNITVFIRWSGNAADLVFPVLGLFLHASLTALIVFRKKYLKCFKEQIEPEAEETEGAEGGLAFSE